MFFISCRYYLLLDFAECKNKLLLLATNKIIMPQIKLGVFTLNYDVIRSPRSKGISIKISPMSGITVILPLKLGKYVNTDNLIREKRNGY